MPFAMLARSRAAQNVLRAFAGLSITLLVSIESLSGAFSMQTEDNGAHVPPWPCRLVVRPTLFGVIEDAWKRSPTLRQQCEELAAARAVVKLEWAAMDSQSRAITEMGVHDGVVVARALIPAADEVIELVAHELQHVVEKVRGLDHKAEAGRPRSGVWRAFGGYETQAAIDAGRQVAREVREAKRPRP